MWKNITIPNREAWAITKMHTHIYGVRTLLALSMIQRRPRSDEVMMHVCWCVTIASVRTMIDLHHVRISAYDVHAGRNERKKREDINRKSGSNGEEKRGEGSQLFTAFTHLYELL